MALAPFILPELLLKLLYVTGFIFNIVGLVTGSAFIRKIGIPLCPGSLSLLLLSWSFRLGWVCPPYAYSVLIGLAFILFGDLIMAEPSIDYLVYTGFLCFIFAGISFIIGISLPTQQIPYNNNNSNNMVNNTSSGSPIPNNIRIPLHCNRSLLPLIIFISGILVWYIIGAASISLSSDDPRFIVAVCFIVVHTLLIWRALARIGYQAPLVTVAGLLQARKRKNIQSYLFSTNDGLPGSNNNNEEDDFGGIGYTVNPNSMNSVKSGSNTRRGIQRLRQQRAERNRRQAVVEANATENRVWQWCGFLGTILMTTGALALGYERLWLLIDPDKNGYNNRTVGILTYTYVLFSWLGQTLITASVPCTLRHVGTLDDPVVCPFPFDGPPLRVLIILPTTGYDIAEVAIPWYILTRRGHKVSFATRGGRNEIARLRRLPVPNDISVHGYGFMGATNNRSIMNNKTTNNRLSVADELCCCSCCNLCASFGFACSPTEFGFGIGTPGPLVVAMYREMLEDNAFRRPLAWKRPTEEELLADATDAARRARRKKSANGPNRKSNGPYTRSPSTSGIYAGSDHDSGSETNSSSMFSNANYSSTEENSNNGGLTSPTGPKDEITGIRSPVDSMENIARTVNIASLYASPENYDGVIMVGTYPVTLSSEVYQEDTDLQNFVTETWIAGKPFATFSNASMILTQCKEDSNDSNSKLLLQDSLFTGISSTMEWAQVLLLGFLNCRWLPCRRFCSRSCQRKPVTVQEQIQLIIGDGNQMNNTMFSGKSKHKGSDKQRSSDYYTRISTHNNQYNDNLSSPPIGGTATMAHYLSGHNPLSWEAIITWIVTGDSPVLRHPDPYTDANAFVVEDGNLLTGQSGRDAFLLARRFVAKLEEVSTVF